jgi:hypothetical protein
MAGRLLFVAVLSLCVMSGGGALAVEPIFCRQYARAAVVQVQGALQNPRCGAALQGARWSAECPVHYEWCLGVSLEAAGAEKEARTQYLKTCARR